MMELFKSWGLL